MSDTVTRIEDKVREERDEYTQGEDRPLGGYLVLMGVNLAVIGTLTIVARRRGARIPTRVPLADLALLGVATHKISRIIAKDAITSPLRAPFTRYEGTSGPAELTEEVRGRGLRKAVGELLACPFCVGEWVAVALTAGIVLAPRATRLVGTLFAALTMSDVLQFAYAEIESRSDR